MNLNKLFLLMLIGIVCSVSVVSAADVGEASVADNLDDVDFEAVHEDVSLKVYNKYSSISPDMIIAGFQDHSLSFGVDENNTDLGDSALEIKSSIDGVYKVEKTNPVVMGTIDLGDSTLGHGNSHSTGHHNPNVDYRPQPGSGGYRGIELGPHSGYGDFSGNPSGSGSPGSLG